MLLIFILEPTYPHPHIFPTCFPWWRLARMLSSNMAQTNNWYDKFKKQSSSTHIQRNCRGAYAIKFIYNGIRSALRSSAICHHNRLQAKKNQPSCFNEVSDPQHPSMQYMPAWCAYDEHIALHPWAHMHLDKRHNRMIYFVDCLSVTDSH